MADVNNGLTPLAPVLQQLSDMQLCVGIVARADVGHPLLHIHTDECRGLVCESQCIYPVNKAWSQFRHLRKRASSAIC